MVRTLIACLLTATTLGQAQTKTSPKQPSATGQSPAQSSPVPGAPTLKKPEEMLAPVAPTDAVITVRGLCPADNSTAGAAAVATTQNCVMKVTKEQFDDLLKAFNANNQPIAPAARRQYGQAYVDLLIFSEAGKAAGLENSPAFMEVMRVLRLKTLGDLYRNQVAEQYRNPSPQEIEAYYNENQSKYDSAKLTRIYIPKSLADAQATADRKDAYQKKAAQVADDMQARAAKGEPMDKLQKEAYTTLVLGATPPTTDLSTARHGMFPPKLEQEIFSHKPGEVFRSDDGNGYMIYRVESRQTVPIDSVKDEIAREIARRRIEEKFKELTTPVHADYNEGYFGPPAPANLPPRPAPTPSR